MCGYIINHINYIMKKDVLFFLGTEAELIKIFPVILLCKEKMNIHIIASGQNDLNKSIILKKFNDLSIDVELSQEDDIKKNAVGLLNWFVQTYLLSAKKIRQYYGDEFLKNKFLVVHGDTVSTLMGAMIGKKLGMRVCHVEAGLRSHNLFNPFPEEIDRLLTSRYTKIHFAPGKLQCNNLAKTGDIVVDTQYNTILDSLNYSTSMLCENSKINSVLQEKYFVFVMHRQENLLNKKFLVEVINEIVDLSRQLKGVIILHKTTEIALKDAGLLDKIQYDPNILSLPRTDYFDFMKLLDKAEFVITDGGSNQEELFYMGKPCLIMRKNTERKEGIGKNAVMYKGKIDVIKKFGNSYKKYTINKTYTEISPSKIIADYLFERA